MEENFFFCETCGNLALMAISSGVTPYCCGDEMQHLTPNTTDGNVEKHLPQVECINEKDCGMPMLYVRVGSIPHPMTESHRIEFLLLKTTLGFVLQYLQPGEDPEVTFRYRGKPLAVYAYCNLHGLWCAKDINVTNKC